MVEYAIETNKLSKTYNRNKKNQIKAVMDLDLKIRPGEIYGLLGANGAGKTTTVSILTTMIKATSGTAKILGHDVVDASKEVRKLIGSLPQETGLYEEFNSIENLEFMAKLRGMKKEEYQTQIASLLDLVGLTKRQSDRVETFSGGMKRRLMIARSLLGNPEIIFLDEPTAGIDVLVSRNVRDIIRKLANERNITVLLSTHDMISAEKLCDRVGILHHGKLVVENTPENIITDYSKGSGDLEDAVVNIIGWNVEQED